MFASLRATSLLVACLFVLSVGCAGEMATETEEPFLSELTYGDSPHQAEKRDIAQRLLERRPAIEDMLMAELVGEGDDALLVPEPSVVAPHSAELALIEADNADRMDLYELIVGPDLAGAIASGTMSAETRRVIGHFAEGYRKSAPAGSWLQIRGEWYQKTL